MKDNPIVECGCGCGTKFKKYAKRMDGSWKPRRFVNHHYDKATNNRRRLANTGAKNVNWKGNKVGYMALHAWLYTQIGRPEKCEHCKDNNQGYRKYHWANKSGKYKRDLDDWIRLCARCHRAYDKKTFKKPLRKYLIRINSK